jgi:hypothetical protein
MSEKPAIYDDPLPGGELVVAVPESVPAEHPAGHADSNEHLPLAQLSNPTGGYGHTDPASLAAGSESSRQRYAEPAYLDTVRRAVSGWRCSDWRYAWLSLLVTNATGAGPSFSSWTDLRRSMGRANTTTFAAIA